MQVGQAGGGAGYGWHGGYSCSDVAGIPIIIYIKKIISCF